MKKLFFQSAQHLKLGKSLISTDNDLQLNSAKVLKRTNWSLNLNPIDVHLLYLMSSVALHQCVPSNPIF